MEVFSYAMAQPYKIVLTMTPGEVNTEITKFWEESGERLMKAEPGGWTKVSAFREHIEKKSGVKVYYDIIWGWCEVAAKKSGLRVENISSINVDRLSETEGGIVSMVVNCVPKVKLGDYKNIKITEPPMSATKQEIDGQVFLALNHSNLANTIEVDKILEEGDSVKLSYVCKTTDTDLVVDSREEITVALRRSSGAALTDAIIGEHTNTEVSKISTLPEGFPDPALANKDIYCKFKIGPAIIMNVPTEEEEALNNNISVEEWRNKIKDEIELNKKETFELRRKDFIRTEVEKVLLATSEVEPLPDSMIEKEADALTKSLAAARSKSVEDYLKEVGMSQDEMFRQFAPMAMRRIMVKLIVDAIATQEGMEVTDEKREECLAKYATESGKGIEEIRSGFAGADIDFLVKTYMVDGLLCDSTLVLPAPELNIMSGPGNGTPVTTPPVEAKSAELNGATES